MAKPSDSKSSKSKDPKKKANPTAAALKAKQTSVKSKTTSPSRIKDALVRTRHSLFLTFLMAILITVAAGTGAYIVYEVQRNIWEQRFQDENKQQLITTRVDLLDRTVKLMSKSLAVQSVQKTDKKMSMKAIAKLGLDPGSIIDVISDNLDKATLEKCKFLEKTAEYEALLQMDYIFFGDSTKQIIDKMWKIKPWWSINDKIRRNLIDAMHYDFIDGFTPATAALR